MLLRQLRVEVGEAADATTRTLASAWSRAWSTLAPDLRAALMEVTVEAVRLGHWPRPWELARIHRLQVALEAVEQALATLGARTGVLVTDAAGDVIRATADAEPRLIASQLPAAERTAAAERFAARLLPSALDLMVARTAGQITAASRPLSRQAMEAVRRSLIRGVVVGANPRATARDMLRRTEGDFLGGLTRANNIARTETLDAYRATSRYAHASNADVLSSWTWLSALDRRTCPSCWAMHGTEHPVSEPGPLDHQQGRCARMPTVKPWAGLGIGLDEPSSVLPDAQARFRSLPKADQLAVMGPARLELLNRGDVAWVDLAARRDNADWRSSYAPTPVRDLRPAA